MQLFELIAQMPQLEKVGYFYIEDFLKANSIPYNSSVFSENIDESNAEKALEVYHKLLAEQNSVNSNKSEIVKDSMGFMEKLQHESSFSAASGNQYQYVVLQVTLKEKFFGTGSGNLTELETVINQQAQKGYRLHTITTASGSSKGLGGGDRIQATMVFEKVI